MRSGFRSLGWRRAVLMTRGRPAGRAARTRHRHAEQHQGHDGHASDRRRGVRCTCV